MTREPDPPSDPDVHETERSTSGRSRAAGRRAGLELDEIRRRAGALINEVGVEKFSMRRLAAELGVTPMSLYHYVRNKQELTELLQRGLMQLLGNTDPALPWDRRLEHVMTHAVAVARTYPRLALYSIQHPEFMMMNDAFFADVAGALREGGIPENRLSETMTWLVSFFAGTVMMETLNFQRKIDPDLPRPDSALAIELIVGAVHAQIARYRTSDKPGGAGAG